MIPPLLLPLLLPAAALLLPAAVSPLTRALSLAHTRPHTSSSSLSLPSRSPPCRYKHLVGKECEVPQSGGRRIAIIADEYVDREFGTGALKITPGEGGS